MTALAELDRLVADAAAPIPSLQALLDTGNPGLHMPAIKELIGIIDARLSQIADTVGRLKTAGEGAVMTVTHSPADLRDQWDRLRLDLEVLNRKHDQLSDSEYGKRFDDIVQALGDIETAIQHAPANDWQTVLVKLHVAVGLAQDQVGNPDKHDHPLVELLRTVTRDLERLTAGMQS